MVEDSDDRNKDDVSPEEFTRKEIEANIEERRRENLAHAEFKDCEHVRKAGDLYQNSECETPRDSIELVSEEIAIDQEDATRLLSIYTRIFTELCEASGYADTSGREYFAGKSIEEIAENNDRTPDKIRKDIREFVGAYIKNHEVKEVDLDQPLPDLPYEPYRELFDELLDVTNIVKEYQIPNYLPKIELMPIIKSHFDFPIEPIIKNYNLGYDELQEVITPTLSVFEEANLQFEDEFVQAISQGVESPPDNWEAYSLVDKIEDEDERTEDIESCENYEEEGSKAVAQLGNIDREAARKLYLRFWDASWIAAESMGSHISDGKIAVIATIATVLFLYTGNFAAATAFMLTVFDKVSNFSPD